MKTIYNKNELLEYLCNNCNFWLYGAGSVGTKVYEYISDYNLDRKISGFIVSENNKVKRKLFNKEIFSVAEIQECEIGKIILCVESVDAQIDMEQRILSIKDCDVIKLSELCIAEISAEYKKKVEQKEIKRMLQMVEKSVPQRELSFSVHLCEHCNLNCAGCNNFSPLAKIEYTDFEVFSKDLEQLSKISGGSAYRIQLTGGEPLLNKNAIQYAIKARELFPKGRISFVTNGILVKQQSMDFYEKCEKYDIEINLTPYPIEMNYEEIIDFLSERGVRAIYHPGDNVKVWRKEPLTINTCDVNKSKALFNWSNCYMANNCIQLKEGKLSCTKISCIHHFMDFYKDETEKMYLSDLDFLDIYKISDIEEIFEFFAKPHPFCKYCNTTCMEYTEWGQSSKNIEEWV